MSRSSALPNHGAIPIGNEKFIVREGQLRYFAASQATLVLLHPSGTTARKLLHVMFNRDGSIFAQCPYFPAGDGALAHVHLPPGETGPITISFEEHGRATSHLVKYSHHVDGNAHFSQDGKIRTEVRRKSFRLDNTIGKLFQFDVTMPIVLEELTKKDLGKSGRVYLPFQFDGDWPDTVSIGAEWRRKRDILANVQPPGADVPPMVTMVQRKTLVPSTRFMLGQPKGYPMHDHLLLLSVVVVPRPEGATKPTLIFLGGLDPHERTEESIPQPQTGFLAFLYPIEDRARMEGLVGSVDFVPNASRPMPQN